MVTLNGARHGVVTLKIGRVDKDGAAGAVRGVVDTLGSTFSLLVAMGVAWWPRWPATKRAEERDGCMVLQRH